jgi:hypothetical protein
VDRRVRLGLANRAFVLHSSVFSSLCSLRPPGKSPFGKDAKYTESKKHCFRKEEYISA